MTDHLTKSAFENVAECITARCRELGKHVRYCPYFEHAQDCDCIYCGGDRIE